MACTRCSVLLIPRFSGLNLVLQRTLCTTTTLHSKLRRPRPELEKWRLERFPLDPTTKTGPLVDLPDYTYLDGRPTPLGVGQLRRKKENYGLAKRIVTLVKELEGAKEKYALKQEEEASRRQAIIAGKLKQKSEEP